MKVTINFNKIYKSFFKLILVAMIIFIIAYFYSSNHIEFVMVTNICRSGSSSFSQDSNKSMGRDFTENKEKSKITLHPWFVTGFCDAESYFNITVGKTLKVKTGWLVKLIFGINIHKKDKYLLESIQQFNGVGDITIQTDNLIQYRVSSIKDLELIINHFDKYPLITQKWADYQLFKQAFILVKSKQHLTMEGLIKIVAIKASMNKGLSDELKKAFPTVVPALRPLIENQKIMDLNWLSGFVSGEGCFFVNIKNSRTKTGKQVLLRFIIIQHSRDELLLKSFIEYFDCGNYYLKSDKDLSEFVVEKFSNIFNNIIPFFKEYPIFGIKALDFADFCEAADIMKVGGHLTEDGLKKIMEIKARMNKNRIFNDDFSQ